MASASLVSKVTGAAPYHINADEPSVLDYNTDFKTPNHVDILFAPDEFRTSDHDPVLVGIPGSGGECETDPPVASATADPSTTEAARARVHVTVSLDVSDASPYTVELVSVTASERVRRNEIVVLDDTNFLLSAKAGRDEARIYTITYEATDDCGNQTVFSTTFTVFPRTTSRPR
jgi:hypothetical protein